MMNPAQMVFRLESFRIKAEHSKILELTQMLELLTECKIIVREELDKRIMNGDKI